MFVKSLCEAILVLSLLRLVSKKRYDLTNLVSQVPISLMGKLNSFLVRNFFKNPCLLTMATDIEFCFVLPRHVFVSKLTV